jgi:5-methyltetrahydrofolate--homocysteine methyltransferase
MASKGSYIGVGENIHCTRVRVATGKFVETQADGSKVLLFKQGADTVRLPIPAGIVAGDDWKAGKVRHVAVAVHQGLYGTPAEQDAGRQYVAAMAREQETQGAWFLDLNVDEFSVDRAEKIKAVQWAAKAIQAASSLPLSIDSSDPEILAAGLAACDPTKGKPLINSVSLERASFIPIAAKAGAAVIAGATGENSMPESVEERLANLDVLIDKLQSAGIALSDIYLDPLVYPASVDVRNSVMMLESVRQLRAKYGPSIHFAPGLSNISYGFPKRIVINQVFARLCLDAGCDGGIVDPAQINDGILSSIDFSDESFRLARELLLGNDEYGMNYITAFREKKG